MRDIPRFPGIPAPASNVEALLATTLALKEAVEVLTNQRQGALPPVTWTDLLRLGLIKQGDMPR